jgi:hypothetical protein
MAKLSVSMLLNCAVYIFSHKEEGGSAEFGVTILSNLKASMDQSIFGSNRSNDAFASP